MSRRCPRCGTTNILETKVCEKCGNSFDEQINKEILALKDIRVYGLLILIMGIVSVVEYALNIVNYGSYTSSGFLSLFSGLNSQNLASQLSFLFVILEAIIVISLVIEIIAIVFLRAGFIKLRKGDYDFSTPTTGSTLLIIGLILGMIGIVVVLALFVPFISEVSQGSNPVLTSSLGGIVAGGLITALGGLLILIGYIIGVLLGLHRLSDKFEQPYFEYSWILLLISIVFSPLSLVAGILLYLGSNSTSEKLRNGPEQVSSETGWT